MSSTPKLPTQVSPPEFAVTATRPHALDGVEVDLKALGARAAEEAERSLLQALVRRGLRSSAHLARLLSVDPKTLRQKLRRYGIDSPGEARRTAQLDGHLPDPKPTRE